MQVSFTCGQEVKPAEVSRHLLRKKLHHLHIFPLLLGKSSSKYMRKLTDSCLRSIPEKKKKKIILACSVNSQNFESVNC